MSKLKYPRVVMGLIALSFESVGVTSKAYVYCDFPLKLFGGVPLFVPLMWVLVGLLEYVISSEKGVLTSVLVVWLLDLMILEPTAFT